MSGGPMNADRLLDVYEQISEAPDAIARLRRFVLDLAVRGKLVEQDASDEPVADLLVAISADKKLRAISAKDRKAKPINVLPQTADLPDIPSSWSWVAFGDLTISRDGERKPVSKSERETRDKVYDYYGASGVIDKIDGFLFDKPLLLIGEDGANLINRSTPIAFIARGQYWVNNHAHVLDGLSEDFLKYLELFINAIDLKPYVTGTAQPKMNQAKMNSIPVAVPPLAEQHRIVAKVDELMALCDRLEEARKTREELRDKLTAASLARLTAPDVSTEDFPTHAAFALEALPALTTRPDQIKTLRQNILNLAVRGKLVEQDPADEPASELLKRIAAEKARLVKAGDIRKQKALSLIGDEETSFQLPIGWSWVRLGDLSQFVTSGSRDWAKFYANEGAIFVRMGNLSKDHYRLRLDNIQRVKPPATGEGTRTRLEGGDVLISITGDVGMLGLIPEDFGDAYINQHTAMVRPMPEMKGRYLPELFRSPFAQDQFNAPQRGIKNSFRLTDVTQFVVPLPPLAEQHRIVAKVDALMAFCDRLEAALTEADTTRTRLLEALLHEALEPAATPTKEATK